MGKFIRIWSKNRRKILTLDKKERFAIQTTLLTAGLLVTQFIWEDYRFAMVVILAVLSYALTAWSLKEDIKGIEWLLLFILPVMYVASLSLFYFLLPNRLFTKFIMTVLFSIGIYAILRIENIYNVAAVRSIQLLRVAQSVGLLLTLVIIYLSSNILYSLRLPYWLNMFMILPLVFILALQSLWSINLESKFSPSIIIYSGIVTLIMGELAVVLSFWPVQNSLYSLVMAACYYAFVGLIQQYLQDKLFKNVISEFILGFIFAVFLILLTSKWGG